jgi:hypothetical protein
MQETMNFVRCKMGDKILGPMKVSELRTVPGFTLSCLVSAESTDTWTPAFQSIDLTAYFEQRTPARKEPIDPNLLSAVENLESHERPQTLVLTGDPAFPSKGAEMSKLAPSDKPGRARKSLLAVALILISGGVYGAIQFAAPLIRKSLFSHALPLPTAFVAPIPVTTIPSPEALITAPPPVKKAPVVKVSVHHPKHTPAAKTHKKKHKIAN